MMIGRKLPIKTLEHLHERKPTKLKVISVPIGEVHWQMHLQSAVQQMTVNLANWKYANQKIIIHRHQYVRTN